MRLYTFLIIALGLLLRSVSIYAVTAEQFFPDKLNSMEVNGVEVRKGTIAATIQNVQLIDMQLQQELPDYLAIKKAADDIKALLPSLAALELFEIFPLEQWLTATKPEGQPYHAKRWVALAYLQNYPQNLNKTHRDLIRQVKQALPNELKHLCS